MANNKSLNGFGKWLLGIAIVILAGLFFGWQENRLRDLEICAALMEKQLARMETTQGFSQSRSEEVKKEIAALGGEVQGLTTRMQSVESDIKIILQEVRRIRGYGKEDTR